METKDEPWRKLIGKQCTGTQLFGTTSSGRGSTVTGTLLGQVCMGNGFRGPLIQKGKDTRDGVAVDPESVKEVD